MKVGYKIVINHKNVPKKKFLEVCVDSLVHLQFGQEKIVTKGFISFSKLIWVEDCVKKSAKIRQPEVEIWPRYVILAYRKGGTITT